MRRVVREYIAAPIDRAKLDLEGYIAQHLRYPEAFPFSLSDPVALIREIRQVKITPRFRADYPPVDVIITMQVALTGKARKRDVELGERTLTIGVELGALGTPQGHGYDVSPEQANSPRGGVQIEVWLIRRILTTSGAGGN